MCRVKEKDINLRRKETKHRGLDKGFQIMQMFRLSRGDKKGMYVIREHFFGPLSLFKKEGIES